MIAKISETIHRQKKSPTWQRQLYPPGWYVFKPYFTGQALNPIKYWLIVIPLLSGMISMFPIEAEYQDLHVTIGGEFEFPFSLKTSYLAALSYVFAFAIYALRIPAFVKNNPAEFNGIPQGVTKTEIADEFRETAIRCLSESFQTRSGTRYSKQRSGEYRRLNTEVEGSDWSAPSLEEAEELIAYYTAQHTHTQTDLLKDGELPLRCVGTDNPFWKSNGMGGKEFIFRNMKNKRFLELLLLPNLRIRDRDDRPDFVAVKTYTNLYLCLSETRALSRAMVWAFLMASITLGILVLGQIIFKGIGIILTL